MRVTTRCYRQSIRAVPLALGLSLGLSLGMMLVAMAAAAPQQADEQQEERNEYGIQEQADHGVCRLVPHGGRILQR